MDMLVLIGCLLLYPFLVLCIALSTDDSKDPRRN